MSPSKPSDDEYEVHFHLWDSSSPVGNDLCTTEIYSPSGTVYAPQQGNFSLQLPKGIYRARVRGYGQVKDSLFVVEETGQTWVYLDRPLRYSSAPLEDVGGSHEYYRESFLQRSVTRAPLTTGASEGPYLFIFIRMKDETRAANQSVLDAPGHLFSGLSLLDREGRLLCRFKANEMVQDRARGFARFRAAIVPGYYRLMYTAEDGRNEWMPIHVLPMSDCAWDTDISLIWWQGRPQLLTVSLFTPVSSIPTTDQRDAHFYEEQVRDIDAVIQTLSSGTRMSSVSSGLVRSLLKNKYSNPMLGILGLHMVLLGQHPDRSNIDFIVQNLRRLAPSSPDVEALRYIAWEKGLIEAPDAWHFNDIPMIRLGAQAMHRAQLEVPTLFADDSAVPNHAEQLFLHFQSSSPWSKTGLEEQPSLLEDAASAPPPKPAKLLELGETYQALPLIHNLAESKTVRYLHRTLADLAINRIAKSEALEPLSVSSLLKSSNARVPDWLVEILLQELPNLKTSYEKGELREELKKISARYEVLLPTLYKLAMELVIVEHKG